MVPSSAGAAQPEAAVLPGQHRTHTFLTGILSGNVSSGWAARSTWQNVFRAGVPSFFGSEFLSPTSYSSDLYLSETSPVVSSPVSATKQGASVLTIASSNGVTVRLVGGPSSLLVAQPQTPALTVNGIPITESSAQTVPAAAAETVSAEPIQDTPAQAAQVALKNPPPPRPDPDDFPFENPGKGKGKGRPGRPNVISP